MSAILSCPTDHTAIIDRLEEFSKSKNYLNILDTLNREPAWVCANSATAGRYIRQIHFKRLLEDKNTIEKIYDFFSYNSIILTKSNVIKHFIAELNKNYKEKNTRRFVFFLNVIARNHDIPIKYLLATPEQEERTSADRIVSDYKALHEYGFPLEIRNNGRVVANLRSKEIPSVLKILRFVNAYGIKKCELDATVSTEFFPSPSTITPRFSETSLHEFFLACKLCIFPFKSIILTGNTISPSAMTMLVDAVNTNPKIEKLILKHCNIQPEAARILAEGLRGNCTLKHLSLADNPIGGHGVEALLASTLVNKVEVLDLRHIPPSDRSVTALRAYGELLAKPTKIFITAADFTDEEYDYLHTIEHNWPYLYAKEGGKCHYIGNEKLSPNAVIYTFDTEGNPFETPITDRLVAIFNKCIEPHPIHPIITIRAITESDEQPLTIILDNKNLFHQNCFYLIDPNFIMVAGHTKTPGRETQYHSLYHSLHRLALNPGEYRVALATSPNNWTTITLEFD